MADSLELTHEDYKNFIKHCRECNSTFEIKTFIDRKLAKYHKENDDILICLEEKIEELDLDDIENDLEEEDPYYTWNVSNFKLDLPNATNIQLKYLYSYLCFLSYDDIEYQKIVGASTKEIKPEAKKSFRSRLSGSQLKDLFKFMAHENSYLEKRAEADFMQIFSAIDLDQIKPIRWLSQYRSRLNTRLLFELIKHLCKHEYLDIENKNSFYDKLAKCVLEKDGQKLDPDNLRSNFSKWKKKTYTDQCLETKNYRNENFLLLNYLRENNLLDSQQ